MLPALKSLLEFKMKKVIFTLMLLMLADSHHAFAGEWDKARDFAVDQELSEMKSASVILPPGKHAGGNLNPKTGQIPGLGLSDAGATAKGGSAGIGAANTGNLSGANPGEGGNAGNETNGGDTGLNAGTGGGGTVDANLDADTGLQAGTGETGGGTENPVEETPTIGGDVSAGGDYLIDADVSVGDTEISADLIPSDSLDDTIVGETTDIGAEIDASGDLSGSEADIGVEADVDGSVSGDDIGSDPADGLNNATSTPTL